MVLSSRRAACAVLMMGLPTVALVAQQPPAPQPRAGEVRPLLYGFALGCTDCAPGEGARGRGRGGQTPAVSYRLYPYVIAVAPGSSAEQAGIRPGDVLKTIDGVSVTTDSGSKRLTQAKTGEQVRLTFERDSKPVVVTLRLGATSSNGNGTRANRTYGGYMAMEGSTPARVKLEIWSDDPIVPDDPSVQKAGTGSDSTGTIVLRIGTSTVIKLQLTKKADSTAKRPE